MHSEFMLRIRFDKVSIDSPSLRTRLCASKALRHLYPETYGMAIVAPPTSLFPVPIASLFFVFVSVHALTPFLDCLANLLNLFYLSLAFRVWPSIDWICLSLHAPCCQLVCFSSLLFVPYLFSLLY